MSSFDPFPSHSQGYQTEAIVKWFNLSKGFGFVAPADGSSDAFLHSSAVSGAGLHDIAEGTRLSVMISDGPKGRQVDSIVSVLGMGEVPQRQDQQQKPFHGRPAPTGPETEVSGTVKWFKPDKGFGFVAPDDGDRDIFVHRSVLQDAGIQYLESGQRVKMRVQSASKGREASWIEMA